jgi:hypothetical protein
MRLTQHTTERFFVCFVIIFLVAEFVDLDLIKPKFSYPLILLIIKA